MAMHVQCAFTRLVPIGEVKPHPRNPNKHPARQIKMLAALIEFHGWRSPITVSNLTGFVIRGHARLEAARVLGLKEVPVDFQDYSDPMAEIADLVADNRVQDYSELDMSSVGDFLNELSSMNFDLDMSGFTLDECSLFSGRPGEAPQFDEHDFFPGDEGGEGVGVFEVDGVDPPKLKDGDRAPYQQMTFTLHDEQAEEIKAALKKAKSNGFGQSAVNENSNGNALAWICQVYNNG
jgi:hypothetical protein